MSTRNTYQGLDPWRIIQGIADEGERVTRERGLAPYAPGPALPSLPPLPAVTIPNLAEQATELPVSWWDRRKAGGQLKGLDLNTAFLEKADKNTQARMRLLLTWYDAQEAVLKRRIEIPFRAHVHTLLCVSQVAEATGIVNEALHRLEMQHVEHAFGLAQRTQELTNRLLKESNREEELRGRRTQARQIGRAAAEEEHAGHRARVARSQASADEYRTQSHGHRRKREVREDDQGGFSPVMRESLARSGVSERDHREVERRVGEIYTRAALAGRPLTDEEQRTIHHLLDCLETADATHRTSAASDLGLGEE